MSRESLARRLRVLRAERGLTLRQVEELTGVDKHTISNVERGESKPYDATLAKLAGGYGVDVEELLVEKTEAAVPLAEAPEASGREERKDVKGPGKEWGPDQWRPDPEQLPEPGGERIQVNIGGPGAHPGAQVTITRKTFDELMDEMRSKDLSNDDAWERLRENTA